MQFPGLAIEHGFVYSTDDIIEFHGLKDLSGILFVKLRFPCYNTSGYELLWTLSQGVPSNDRVTPTIVHGGNSWLIKTVNERAGLASTAPVPVFSTFGISLPRNQVYECQVLK